MSADILILPVVRSDQLPELLRSRTVEGWAVWNDCQGVFVGTVSWRKNDAAKFEQELSTPGAKIVPVLITIDNDPLRELVEEREYGDWE